MTKQFCPQGHNKTFVGRATNRQCRFCRREQQTNAHSHYERWKREAPMRAQRRASKVALMHTLWNELYEQDPTFATRHKDRLLGGH